MSHDTLEATKARQPAPSAPTPAGAPLQLKSTLRGSDLATQMKALTPRPVQRHGDGAASQDVHAAAAHGTSGSGGALPHLSAIQQSFGGHDVSNVQAHVGGAAKEASAAMGAEAYASGNDVAFQDTPSLHTAAHEAAHVVQQRAGVQLSGGVGQAGDSYEQHADKVADAVVAGQSAEGLLGSPGGGGEASVQRRVQRLASPVQMLAPVAPMPGPGVNFGGTTPNTSEVGDTPELTGGGTGTALPNLGGTAGADPGATVVPPTVAELKAIVKVEDHTRWLPFKARCEALGISAAEAETMFKLVIDGLIAAEGAQTVAGVNARDPGWEDRARALIAQRELAAATYFRPVIEQLVQRASFAQYLGGRYALWGGGDGAKEYAASKGFTILETTQAGSLFDGLGVMNGGEWNCFGTLWAELSAAFARHCAAAGGQIHGFFRWFGDTYRAFEEPQVRSAMATGKLEIVYRPIDAVVGDGKKGEHVREVGKPTITEAGWQAEKAAFDAKKASLTAAGRWNPQPSWPDPIMPGDLDGLNP